MTLKPGYIVVHDGQKYLVQSAQNITIERKEEETNTLKTITIGVQYNVTLLSEESLERMKQTNGGKLVYPYEYLFREASQ